MPKPAQILKPSTPDDRIKELEIHLKDANKRKTAYLEAVEYVEGEISEINSEILQNQEMIAAYASLDE